MRGTASPRAHPGATSEVFVPVLSFFRFLVALVVDAAVFAADVRSRRSPARSTRCISALPSPVPCVFPTGPAERSIRYGSRGPSRTSRPDRARNNSPHHVGGTGWGESAKTRGIACLSAVLPCRIDLYLGRLETRASPSRRPSVSSSWSTLQPASVFLLKIKIASPWPHFEQPFAGRDSLEARVTLKTSSQTVKADSKDSFLSFAC